MDAAEMFDWLDDEMCDLRCVSTSNADAGDYSVHWEVIEHYQGKPSKVVGTGDSPSAAIFDATLEPGDVRRSDYVPPEYT